MTDPSQDGFRPMPGQHQDWELYWLPSDANQGVQENLNTINNVGFYNAPSYASTATFNDPVSDSKIENPLQNNQSVYTPENLQRIRLQLLQLSSVTDDLSCALATLSKPSSDQVYVTKDAFNRKIRGWSQIIDLILDTSVSLAYKDENFEWPEDENFQKAIDNYTPYAIQAYEIVTNAVEHTISQQRNGKQMLARWNRQKDDVFTFISSIVHWCVDAIYQFRDSAKAAGYKLAYRYGFQLGDGPDVKKNNLKLYKIFETNEREFMDANCENGDVSPFINQTLMDVYRETVYQGPHAIAWRMIILFRLLPILEKLAPHLLWKEGGGITGYTLVSTGARYGISRFKSGIFSDEAPWRMSDGSRFEGMMKMFRSDEKLKKGVEAVGKLSAGVWYPETENRPFQLKTIQLDLDVDSDMEPDSDTEVLH